MSVAHAYADGNSHSHGHLNANCYGYCNSDIHAGSYRYGLDIDDCIEQAMIMAQQIKEGGRDYPVPMEIYR